MLIIIYLYDSVPCGGAATHDASFVSARVRDKVRVQCDRACWFLFFLFYLFCLRRYDNLSLSVTEEFTPCGLLTVEHYCRIIVVLRE